jgi:hypothetical protein
VKQSGDGEWKGTGGDSGERSRVKTKRRAMRTISKKKKKGSGYVEHIDATIVRSRVKRRNRQGDGGRFSI